MLSIVKIHCTNSLNEDLKKKNYDEKKRKLVNPWSPASAGPRFLPAPHFVLGQLPFLLFSVALLSSTRSPYLHSPLDSSQEMALSDMLLRTLRLSLSLLIQSSLSSYFHLFGFNSRQCIFPSPAEYQCFFLISGSPSHFFSLVLL